MNKKLKWILISFLSLAIVVLLFKPLFLPVVGLVVRSKISRYYTFDVDHRLVPHSLPDINEDGIRSLGKAEDIHDDDFVIIMMGDSFTFGYRAQYNDTYPAQLQKLFEQNGNKGRVVVVNFAWLSSSPLLGMRLLKDIGAKYKPDLIVYNLDMTDFHDDLDYEFKLQQPGGFEVSLEELGWQAVEEGLKRSAFLHGFLNSFKLLRATFSSAITVKNPTLPHDRFFATSMPLNSSQPLIERGVVRNLSLIDDYAQHVLKCPMALVIIPRAYQYSDRESQHNWERDEYDVLGPYVKMPFQYFSEQASKLPFPILGLLDEFQKSQIYPLYLDNDPHWNSQGSLLAAQTVFRWLVESGLAPAGEKSAV
jgi:hypothetical protein